MSFMSGFRKAIVPRFKLEKRLELESLKPRDLVEFTGPSSQENSETKISNWSFAQSPKAEI
jgi:hypothetical protein